MAKGKTSKLSAANPKRSFRVFDVDKDKLNHRFDFNMEETRALRDHYRNRSTLTIDDLRRIALWKFDRVLGVSDETLAKLGRVAEAKSLKIDDKPAREALAALVDSPGVGYPLASAILKLLRPDVFPIIDVRAYRALTGKKPYRHTYTEAVYLDYARRLLAIALKHKRPLSEIDEQLYEFDKTYNGTI